MIKTQIIRDDCFQIHHHATQTHFLTVLPSEHHKLKSNMAKEILAQGINILKQIRMSYCLSRLPESKENLLCSLRLEL
jgi:hypothetical protein